LFLPALNYDIQRWVNAWNNHGMQLPGNERNGQSPRAQWFFGMYHNGPRGLDTLESVDNPDEYGVDWEASRDRRVQQHLQENNPFPDTTPQQMTQINVDPPTVNLDDLRIAHLVERLQVVVDLESPDMDVRTHAWIQGLLIAEELQ
jgi:hypothetical protein